MPAPDAVLRCRARRLPESGERAPAEVRCLLPSRARPAAPAGAPPELL